MNIARAKRRWRKWDRYIDRLIKLSEHTVCSRGAEKSLNERIKWSNRRLSKYGE